MIEPYKPSSASILIVDDTPENLRLLVGILSNAGYQIRPARDGRTALQSARAALPDLILLDIMMPEMDGYQVLAEMNADTLLREIPVIMISAVDEIDSVVRCIELGAADYLSKPFNPALLKARIGTYAEKARYRAQEAAYHQQVEQEKKRSDDLLATLAQVQIPADTEARFAECWRVLAMAAERTDARAVDDEYHDLFIGLGRGQVMPYASWYLTGFLMDRPLAVLRADLAALGIERQVDVREPEDHAAALCETMAMLCAGGSDLDGQRRFFRAHMEPWLGTFMTDLQAAPSAQFYKAVGCLGERFMEFESRYMAMML